MLIAFKEHLKNSFPDLREKSLLIAISGGLDSVVLTHLLHRLEFKITLTHCNFNLRAAESDEDEQFINNLAHDLNIECHTTYFNTMEYASQKGISIQMAARELRYDYFKKICDANNYDYILTAHHLDDQIETFLINLNRGAGLNGLQGIPQENGIVLRPLLPFSRDQIKQYALENDISWREDSSNASNKYQRNQLRNQILPLLHQALPELKAHFYQTLEYLKGSQDLIEDVILRFRESAIQNTKTGIKIDIFQLNNTSNPKMYLYEIVKDYGFQNMKDAMDVVNGISGKKVESSTHLMVNSREWLLIEQKNTFIPVNIQIDNIPGTYKFYDKILQIERLVVENPLEIVKKNRDKNIHFLNAQAISSLNLRNWKHGDRIKPFGMNGSKLVSDVLTDSKVSFIAKEKLVIILK